MAIGSVSVGGAGSLKMNIFIQESQPVNNEGIWIETSSELGGVVFDDNVVLANSWIYNYPAPMASRRGQHSSIVFNDKLYVFGGRMNDAPNYAAGVEVYDFKDKVWTVFPNNPHSAGYTQPFIHENELYLAVQTGAGGAVIVGYNTFNNTWTTISPGGMRGTSGNRFEYYDGFVYHFAIGGGATDVHVYDFSTNSWTTRKYRLLAEMTYMESARVGSKIYLFGGSYAPSTLYVYDIRTNEITNPNLSISPTQKTYDAGGMIAVGNDIYIVGGRNTKGILSSFEMYSVNDDVWTTLPDVPNQIHKSSLAYRDRNLLVIGGTPETSHGYISTSNTFTFDSKQYENNSVVIQYREDYYDYDNQYGTQLVGDKSPIKQAGDLLRYSTIMRDGRLMTYFYDAWLFKNGDLHSYPTYYGNGKTWVQFK